jgi:hypothetical protein
MGLRWCVFLSAKADRRRDGKDMSALECRQGSNLENGLAGISFLAAKGERLRI